MPTKAELKSLSKPVRMKVRKGDRVVIISGKDRGQIGYIAAVAPRERKVIVLKDNPDNPEQPIPLNAVIKHRKARFQNERSARIQLPAPIDASNVMVLDSEGKPTRVGRRREDGKLVRYAKSNNKNVVNAPVMDEK